ncbi:MAG: peptide-binding protein [Pseudomonadota bacterium]
MRFSLYLLLLAALVLSVALAACDQNKTEPAASGPPGASEEKNAVPAPGDMLVGGSIGDASSLLPALVSDSASRDVTNLVYNGLVKVDENLNLVGDLAESWDVSPDGLALTFHLRKGVKWHDGAPFTARDALFTYQLMIDPRTKTAYGEDFKQARKAEIIDDHTFRVEYGRAFAPGLSSWSMEIMPEHLLAGVDLDETPLARRPVGTGPYRFKEWETGRKIVLEANPDYFAGPPYLQRTVIRIIPDQAAMFLELKSGGLDLTALTPTQYVEEANSPEFAKNFKKYRYLQSAYTYLGFNLLDPKFQDRRVRQAIALALDKEEIVKGVLLGLGAPANGPYKPGTWQYNPDVKPYPFDQGRARELLAEAGWKEQDGVLARDGQPFEFTIITNQGNRNREMTALIIQQRLRELGILVKIRTIEWAAFLKEFVDKKNFEAVILSWTIPPDPDPFDVWPSSKTRAGELNFISYGNPEVDRLIDQGRYTFDQAERQKAYFRFQEILREDVPCVFLYIPDALPVASSRIMGIKPAPAGIDYNRPRWFVPQNRQKYQARP